VRACVRVGGWVSKSQAPPVSCVLG